MNKFQLNNIVCTNEKIFKVVSVPTEKHESYKLSFQAYLGEVYNSSDEIFRDYSKIHIINENDLQLFSGNPPKFFLGDYVSCSQITHSNIHRVFFCKYISGNYVYFVQEKYLSPK